MYSGIKSGLTVLTLGLILMAGNIHGMQKKYSCYYCNHKTQKSTSILNHCKLKHKNEPYGYVTKGTFHPRLKENKSEQCFICDKSFESIYQCSEHLVRHSQEELSKHLPMPNGAANNAKASGTNQLELKLQAAAQIVAASNHDGASNNSASAPALNSANAHQPGLAPAPAPMEMSSSSNSNNSNNAPSNNGSLAAPIFSLTALAEASAQSPAMDTSNSSSAAPTQLSDAGMSCAQFLSSIVPVADEELAIAEDNSANSTGPVRRRPSRKKELRDAKPYNLACIMPGCTQTFAHENELSVHIESHLL